MHKFIRVWMPNGEIWDVPAEIIAKKVAEESMKDIEENHSHREEIFNIEFNSVMAHDRELLKFSSEKFNWSEVMPLSQRMKPPQNMSMEEYQKSWLSGKKEVVWK